MVRFLAAHAPHRARHTELVRHVLMKFLESDMGLKVDDEVFDGSNVASLLINALKKV